MIQAPPSTRFGRPRWEPRDNAMLPTSRNFSSWIQFGSIEHDKLLFHWPPRRRSLLDRSSVTFHTARFSRDWRILVLFLSFALIAGFDAEFVYILPELFGPNPSVSTDSLAAGLLLEGMVLIGCRCWFSTAVQMLSRMLLADAEMTGDPPPTAERIKPTASSSPILNVRTEITRMHDLGALCSIYLQLVLIFVRHHVLWFWRLQQFH